MIGFAAFGQEPIIFSPLAVTGGALIIYSHRDNIRRLLSGTERRFGQPAETDG